MKNIIHKIIIDKNIYLVLELSRAIKFFYSGEWQSVLNTYSNELSKVRRPRS